MMTTFCTKVPYAGEIVYCDDHRAEFRSCVNCLVWDHEGTERRMVCGTHIGDAMTCAGITR